MILLLEKADSPHQLRHLHNPDTVPPRQLEYLLILACYLDRTKSMQTLISELGVDVNAVSSGATVLILSAWSGHAGMVKWLISYAGGRLELHTRGTLLKTSICGGTGPFTAKEWAGRKALVCPENPSFLTCVRLIELEEKRRRLAIPILAHLISE
jgi:hypothetical protein